MGLISKIEDKLSGSSSSNTNKLEKSSGYDTGTSGTTSSATSKLQNPISSSGGGPTGSAVPTSGSSNNGDYTSTASQSATQREYPSTRDQTSSGYTSNLTDRTGGSSYPQQSSTGGYTSSGQPSATETAREYPSTRDTAGGYDTSTSSSRMPGSYVQDESHIPQTSSTSSTSRGPTQPYDPYSSKGQETAARAGATSAYGSSQPTTQNYSRTTGQDDLSRSRDGGILNQTSPTSTSQTDSSHHYGRDAAIAGGAGLVGAGGVGAYEMNKNQSSTQPLTSSTDRQDVSYMHPQQTQTSTSQTYPTSTQDRSVAGGVVPGASPTSTSQTGTSQTGGTFGITESAGLTQARKMGGAFEQGYEAGYRDAKAEFERSAGKAF